MKHQYADGRTVWKSSEIALAARIWQEDFADHYGEGAGAPRGARQRVLQKIAAAIGRTVDTVNARLTCHGPSFHTSRANGLLSGRALADLAARKAAEAHHSLIGAVMGDPPPGFSALDRKRKGATP